MSSKILVMLITMLGLSSYVFAQGDLLITPTRVVFDGTKQKEELNIVNIGKDTATYSISFVHYRQNEDGTVVIVEKPDSSYKIAEPYLRIFPRQITLAPGEPQVIMMQCRRKADMRAGEYRSNLYFRSEENYRPLGTKDTDTTSLSVQLIPIYGLSIPVIIRSGSINVNTSLSDLNLETQPDSTQNLKFTINRAGNSSAYGDLTVEHIQGQGKPLQIGKVKGLGVFANIDKRVVSIRLNKTPGLKLQGGNIRLRYTSPDDVKHVLYAEKEASVDELIRANYAITSAK
jgi:hypothetical protein